VDLTSIPALDVLIGLSFVYFVFSLVCSAVNEAVSIWLKLRAKDLERGIANLLDGLDDERMRDALRAPKTDALTKAIYAHPLIRTLSKGESGKPSYIPASAFASAVIDKLQLAASVRDNPPLTKESIKDLLSGVPIGDKQAERLSGTINTLAEQARREMKSLRAVIESWFDDGMDRVSGWYKRRAHVILFCLGIALAGIANADTFQIADRLWNDEAVRAAAVTAAQGAAESDGTAESVCPEDASAEEKAATGADAVTTCLQKLDALRFPLFWDDEVDRPDGFGEALKKSLGLLLTGIALGLGAPFWFDLLQRLVRLRAAGKKPEAASAGAG
jgi:hypothetical protein